MSFRLACLQMCSGRDVAANVEVASRAIREAAVGGAHLVATPEMTSLLETDRQRMFGIVREESQDEALAAFRSLAAELGIWLSVGSLPIKVEDTRLANRSFLIAPDGAIAARYDKIHMFDVQVGEGESYRESKNYRPGEEAVLADTDLGRFGLSVCYDLRFPYLYRDLAHKGAQILFVPSAFTQPTGAAHWHVLLRARAIETGCFVVAAAQSGTHECGRKTYGHSLVVAPWGEVLADGGEELGLTYADIDLARVEEARSKIPSLTHDRSYAGPNLMGHASGGVEAKL